MSNSTPPARFFSDDSYWNQPIPDDSPIAPETDRWVRFLEQSSREPGFYLSLRRWTLPIYETKPDTKWVTIKRRFHEPFAEAQYLYRHSKYLLEARPDHPVGFGEGFGPTIPMPEDAVPDAMTDGHLSIIDRERNKVWDLWGARRNDDGTWSTWSGITYPLDGPGTFDPKRFAISNGETIHLYGPCRASGTPSIAGITRYDEVLSGRIEHKLSFATRFAGLLAHCFPATWTDGGILGGIPEGITMQLDPTLDLSTLGLNDGARVIATAMQEYGAVLIDVCLGSTIGAENLNGHASKSWDGILDERDLNAIPFEHFRFIQPATIVEKGLIPAVHPTTFQTYHELMQLHDEVETEQGTFVGWPKDWYQRHAAKYEPA